MTTTEIASCEDALRLLAAHLDGELDDPAHAGVEAHLARCRSCYSRAEFEKRLKASVAALRREQPRAELTARVRSLIEQFAVTNPE